MREGGNPAPTSGTIQDNVAYHAEFEKPKIIYQEIASYQSFAYAEQALYPNNKCFIIPEGSFYLLAVLNSSVVWFFLGHIVSKLRGGAFTMQSIYLSRVPIPDAPNALRDEISALAQRCLDAAKTAPKTLPALEAELDRLVYQAYDLTDDEIAIIEAQR